MFKLQMQRNKHKKYRWRHALPTTDELVLEAQAVLCFNLEPKQECKTYEL